MCVYMGQFPEGKSEYKYKYNSITPSKQNYKKQMKIQDSLDRQQSSYNLSNQYQNTNTKHAMQNLYKQQLDSFLQQKNKQKEMQRVRQLNDKKEFNQRAMSNKESEKIKEQAYKNYYNMLMSNQEHMQGMYVSPFSGRDALKDQHIAHGVEQGEQRTKQWQIEQRKRQAQRKSLYRSQLMNQIQQRKRLQTYNRQQQQRKKQQFRKYNKLPEEIAKYQKLRHQDQMEKYREDLDRFRTNKQDIRNSRIKSEQNNIKIPQDNLHNAIVNPLPYNIQNPYILREMNKQNYLASRANMNLLS